MPTSDPALAPVRKRADGRLASARSRLALLGGGTEGNEQLTAIVGVILIVLLAVIGITILRVRQLISVHLFVGLLLIGPVLLKMASTGYRFFRYYTREQTYHEKGPPEAILRGIAPIVVLSTVAVFITGLLLLFGGASSRDQYLELHKISFIVWGVFTAIHVLGHLPGMPAALRAVPRGSGPGQITPGARGRSLAMAGALVGGLVLALVLIPDFASWTAAGAIPHHHHH